MNNYSSWKKGQSKFPGKFQSQSQSQIKQKKGCGCGKKIKKTN